MYPFDTQEYEQGVSDARKQFKRLRFVVEKKEHPYCPCGQPTQEVHEMIYRDEPYQSSTTYLCTCSREHRRITNGQKILSMPPRSKQSEYVALSAKEAGMLIECTKLYHFCGFWAEEMGYDEATLEDRKHISLVLITFARTVVEDWKNYRLGFSFDDWNQRIIKVIQLLYCPIHA